MATLRKQADVPKSTQWNRCTAQAESGRFCDDPTMEGAPFPMCIRHGAQLMAFMHGVAEQVEASPVDIRMLVLQKTHDPRRRRDHLPLRPTETIYYVQVGDLLKIGYSTNLRQRLKDYPPNRRLLATEPGGEDMEAQRLAEFSEYRSHGREWFAPGARLLEHVNRLRRSAGAPLIQRFARTEGIATS